MTLLSSPVKVTALQEEVASLLRRYTVSAILPDRWATGLYSPYYLVPKKTGGDEVHSGPKGPQQVWPTLSDVVHVTPSVSSPVWRFCCQHRSKGCVLSCAYHSEAQKVPPFCFLGVRVPVQVPAI